MPYQKIIFAFIGALFIALFAQIEIELPLNEAGISISGQTFAVLLVGFLLGTWAGPLSVLIYLAMGLMDLPVFSGGGSGIDTLFGGSGGYLIGFFIAAGVVGILGERNWGKSMAKCILAMLIGTVVILFLGVLKLSFTYGFLKAMEVGFYPFIWGGVVKVILGGVVAFGVARFKRSF